MQILSVFRLSVVDNNSVRNFKITEITVGLYCPKDSRPFVHMEITLGVTSIVFFEYYTLTETVGESCLKNGAYVKIC